MKLTSIYDTYTLNNGVKIPCVAFGTYKAAQGDNVEILKTAIESGYRYFDTASFYGTEKRVGEAIRSSHVPRKEIFVATKLYPSQFSNAAKAIEEALETLELGCPTSILKNWKNLFPKLQ